MGFVGQKDTHNAISDINCKGAKNRSSSCRRKFALPPTGMDTLLRNIAPLPVKELSEIQIIKVGIKVNT